MECDFEPLTTGPANLVSLLDHSLQPGVVSLYLPPSYRSDVVFNAVVMVMVIDSEFTGCSVPTFPS